MRRSVKYFPMFVDLVDRPCLVVGGGNAAAAKARRLVESGARVILISESPNEELCLLADRGALTMKRRAFKKIDIKGMSLVIGASGVLKVDSEVSKIARASGIPVNVVDKIPLSNFLVPAIVDRGPLQIGINSGGVAPSLSSKIRDQIETILPARIGSLAEFARDHRPTIKQLLPDISARRVFWRKFFDSALAQRVLAGIDSVTGKEITELVQEIVTDERTCGEVAIVGAGPGDPDLLTIRALQKLQAADVIVYDRLVAPAILDRARRDAKRMFVGKASGRHICAQDEINQILLEEARRGHHVVRLKGGDPFIFGRGGEERSFLFSHGITVEVVPGITAALGCGAVTGIPMTHRDVAQAVTFITGHGEEEVDLDWHSLASIQHTLVIYMGVSSAGTIAARLIANGMNSGTPVAVIENGTTPNQKLVKGQLGDLAALIKSNEIVAPALIVIGQVVEQSNLQMIVAGPEAYLKNNSGVHQDNIPLSLKVSGGGR